jgi:hypothetical protein
MPSSKSATPSTASKSGQNGQKRAVAPTVKSNTPPQAAVSKSASATRPVAASGPVRPTLNRRLRAQQRAQQRRRRAVTNWSILGVLVAIVLTALLVVKQPWTGLFSSHSANKTAAACPAPTATAVGPVPAITPPASPPAVQGTSKTTGDGLQEIDVKVGCGAVVQSGQTVVVEYTGWVQSSGKLFDSSFEHPSSQCNGTVANTCGFALTSGSGSQSGVIQGWVEGVAGMKVGGTRRLIIPPALAYGAQGQPPTIPASATLIFDITVVGIQ